jgi:hypothetical protein
MIVCAILPLIEGESRRRRQGVARTTNPQDRALLLIHRRNQKIIKGSVTGFRCHVSWKPVHDPRLSFEYSRIQVFQWDGHTQVSGIYFAYIPVVGRGARDASGVNQHTIADLQV